MARQMDRWWGGGEYGADTVRMVAASAAIGHSRQSPPLRLVVPDRAGEGTGECEIAGGQPASRPAPDDLNGAERSTHHDTRTRHWHRLIGRGRPQTACPQDYEKRIAEQIERLNGARECLGQDKVMLSDLMGD